MLARDEGHLLRAWIRTGPIARGVGYGKPPWLDIIHTALPATVCLHCRSSGRELDLMRGELSYLMSCPWRLVYSAGWGLGIKLVPLGLDSGDPEYPWKKIR